MTLRIFIARMAQALALAGALASPAGCATEPDVPLHFAARQAYWKLHPGNPLIKAGDYLDKALWGDPSVLKVGDTYVMFMSSSTTKPFEPPVLPFRAVSKDGLQWRLDPPRPLMDPSGTPFVSLETPSVVFFKGQYHLYYTGIHPKGKVPAMEIGHATSPDGITWTKDPRPVIASSGNPSEWNGYLVAEPGAIVFNDKVYIYFTAMGARPGGNPPQLQNIGLATSSDGRTFDTPRIAHSQSKLYPPQAGFPGYSTPSALVDGKDIHLFFDVVHYQKNARQEWRQVALQHAVSHDGGLTFIEDAGPLLTRDDTEWSKAGELIGPAALIDGNEVKLWFGGHGPPESIMNLVKRGIKGPEFGIGLMTTDIANLRSAPK